MKINLARGYISILHPMMSLGPRNQLFSYLSTQSRNSQIKLSKIALTKKTNCCIIATIHPTSNSHRSMALGPQIHEMHTINRHPTLCLFTFNLILPFLLHREMETKSVEKIRPHPICPQAGLITRRPHGPAGARAGVVGPGHHRVAVRRGVAPRDDRPQASRGS